jgi:hypothetical protein
MVLFVVDLFILLFNIPCDFYIEHFFLREFEFDVEAKRDSEFCGEFKSANELLDSVKQIVLLLWSDDAFIIFL